MASYTMQLREYIEQATQNENLPVREQIKKGKDKLFDFDYPIFDPIYKNVFETNFIRNFYMREIGFETEGLFKFQLETWLLINMPYFNKLFESELIKYNPLINSETSATHNKTNDKLQNDNRDKTQNDERNKTQNDSRDIIQNDENITHQDSSKNSLTTQVSVQTSNIDGTSEDKTNTISDSDTEKIIDATEKVDNFNRDLESTNPDSRLTISAKDGEGVIDYASTIKENNENNVKDSDSKATGTEHNESDTTSTNASHQDSSTNLDDTLTDNTTTLNNENSTLTSSIDDTLISSVDDTLSSVVNDKLISSINDIEDYVEHKVGKIGTSSYPTLIKEYRESFLRIEKQIFNEMNELFMLVY